MSEGKLEEYFSRIYEKEEWGGSGPGSGSYFTIEYRAFLQRFMALNRVRSIVDIGCGDWQFSRFLDLDGVSYIGFDVVQVIVDRNRARYSAGNIRFELMPDDVDVLPGADLLIVKDVMQHLPNHIIELYLKRLVPRYKWALITNSYQKEKNPVNADIEIGSFRCIDLQGPPFSVGAPYVFEYHVSCIEVIRTMLFTANL